jgi:hypothetical protein
MSARKPTKSRSPREGTREPHKARSARQKLSHAEQLKKLQRWFLPDAGILAGLGLHGNTTWSPVSLVWLALGWAWAETKNVTDAFETAASQCRILGLAPLTTYQGFMLALSRWTDPLMRRLWTVLHRRMQEIGGAFWRIGGWVPVAFDGSRSSTPRTASAEKAFCASHYGQGKTATYRKKKTKGMRRRKNEKHKPQPQEPQVWITLMWHMGLRLPWMWRLGASNSSERAHVMELLDEGDFPENTLFCGDAGFVGYPLWSRMLDRGHHFLVRVGANVSLLQDLNCSLRKNGQVLCWPNAAQRAGQPPLRLRLTRVKIGRTWMWMLTSVLNPRTLSLAQMVEFYELRWGIEVEFRGLKQTLDRARLRCRNDRRLLVELHWSILAMAVAELFALKEQLRRRRRVIPAESLTGDPRKRSLARTLRALRFCLNHLTSVPEPGRELPARLRQAVTDDYVRRSSKRARYRPANPDKKPLGNPTIRQLTADEREELKSIKPQKCAA